MRSISSNFRLCYRFIWLSAELLLAALAYVPYVGLRSLERRSRARALWLQRRCQRLLRVLNVEVEARGPIPTRGLLVSNHLSYLDVLVLGALAPSVFVAKQEVKRWPVFGWFAALGGTVFVDRERRSKAGQAAGKIQAVLEQGHLVVLFPEGTSSDGTSVLPFKSSLLEPATRHTKPLAAAALKYQMDEGSVSEEVCYWKDMTFLPHLLNLLTKNAIVARVTLFSVEPESSCRKTVARQLHERISVINATYARLSAPEGYAVYPELIVRSAP